MNDITQEQRQKLNELLDAGIVAGLGNEVPGQMCIEAAVCVALGEPFGDQPSCVAAPDRAFLVVLNDAPWSSPQARAQGLRELAFSQLGTAGTDRLPWVRAVALRTVTELLPLALRGLVAEQLLKDCVSAKGLTEAAAAAHAANAYAAYAAANAASYAAARSAAHAYDAHAAARAAANAYAAARAAARAAYAAHAYDAHAAARAAAYAYAAARAAARAAAAAANAANAAANADDVLKLSACIALEAYRE